MPCDHRIHTDLGLICIRYSGHVTLEEHRVLEARLVTDPDYSIDHLRLSDCSTMTETDLGLADLIPVLDRLNIRAAAISRPVRWGLFAPSDLCFGMAHIWRSLLEGHPGFEVRIFAETGDLLAFLDLNRPGMAKRLGLPDVSSGA